MTKLEIPSAFIDQVNETVRAVGGTGVKTKVWIKELYQSISIGNTKPEKYFKSTKCPSTIESAFRKFIAEKEDNLLTDITEWIDKSGTL
jgi:hypothetical protein